eukprot:255840-Amphidinium_carterae.1
MLQLDCILKLNWEAMHYNAKSRVQADHSAALPGWQSGANDRVWNNVLGRHDIDALWHRWNGKAEQVLGLQDKRGQLRLKRKVLQPKPAVPVAQSESMPQALVAVSSGDLHNGKTIVSVRWPI